LRKAVLFQSHDFKQWVYQVKRDRSREIPGFLCQNSCQNKTPFLDPTASFAIPSSVSPTALQQPHNQPHKPPLPPRLLRCSDPPQINTS